MSNDEKVRELEKQITKLSSSDSLPTKQVSKLNKTTLLELAKKIRVSVEDYSVEASTHLKPS